MIAATEHFVALICAENGKPKADARAEVGYAAEFFRWYSEETVRTQGAYGLSPAGGTRTIVSHKPVGVAALVTPWNFPAAMATRKIAPALAAGCTVVLKSAAETPLTALAIAKLLTTAGVPDGVVNLVPTTDASGVVSNWLSDDRVRKVSFTGSTGVGRTLLKQAADRVVNASMELGGNAPFVVSAGADVAAAVEGAMIAKFRGGGQACTAANRFYVHASVADEFVALFGAAIEALSVGPASDPGSQVGPLVSARAAEGVRELVSRALKEGAVIAHQAVAPDGWYVAPTLLTGVQPDASILQQEIFGPIAPVVVWDDETELLQWVNGTEYGLAAYVYADRLQDALRIAESIDAGMVGINRGIVSDPSAPFGGTKQSGLGREGGRDGLREFQETQYFSVDFD
jgi:succinate-semialdehyde dehydrogenase / glutarate-semialdehyde dehydrogenase